MGRILREPRQVSARNREANPREGGRGLHCDLPAQHARSHQQRLLLGRSVAPRQAARGRRRHHDQHRHWLARGAHSHHRHLRPPRRLHLCNGEAQAPRDHPPRDNQSHQRPRRRREGAGGRSRGHGEHGAAAAGGPALCAQSRGGPRRRDQHLHCVQPGVFGPHVSGDNGRVSGQPVCVPRDKTRQQTDGGRQVHRGCGCWPRWPCGGDDGSRERTQGDAL
mmetsp:Transcript_32261/g.65411  ORF Transcript_32261/g.65411 Transcript_32261/m.65411 type:complete len:221 (+) Transcript_32261:511-1173(+)